MALVDYSSSSSAASSPGAALDGAEVHVEEEDGPSPKRRKTVDVEAEKLAIGPGASSDMPPLPSAFHDLYASTVRASNVDDSSLHNGRKRVNPHVVGNWPTHLYTEWHPTVAQHDVLVELLSQVEAGLGEDIKLQSFLTSDLGAPLPLHISLSRPLSLPTGDKDRFLDKLTEFINSSGTAPFTVSPKGLAWHRSPETQRNFLILRVNSPLGTKDKSAPNPELMKLLKCCNTAATLFNQLPLYQRNKKDAVGTAFHISIAWTFDVPTIETSIDALHAFSEEGKFRKVLNWKIDVSSVKVKIGNVVTSLVLRGLEKGGASSSIFSR